MSKLFTSVLKLSAAAAVAFQLVGCGEADLRNDPNFICDAWGSGPSEVSCRINTAAFRR